MSGDLKEGQPKPSSVTQDSFLNLVERTGRQPKKILPRWHADTEGILQITGDRDQKKLKRAIASSAGHENTETKQARRKNLGLPDKAMPFKERIMAINALTPEDLRIIDEVLGYKPDRIHQYAPLTQEIILTRLKEYRQWQLKQQDKV